MGQSEDATLRNNATVIKNNILYRPEYRDVFVTVLRNYNEVVSSKALLRDLIETVYLYLRLVEQLCKNRGRIVVQGKRKKRGARGGKRKKSRQEDTEHEPVVLSSEQVGYLMCVLLECLNCCTLCDYSIRPLIRK